MERVLALRAVLKNKYSCLSLAGLQFGGGVLYETGSLFTGISARPAINPKITVLPRLCWLQWKTININRSTYSQINSWFRRKPVNTNLCLNTPMPPPNNKPRICSGSAREYSDQVNLVNLCCRGTIADYN